MIGAHSTLKKYYNIVRAWPLSTHTKNFSDGGEGEEKKKTYGRSIMHTR
jgi:hypothetical protein